MHQETIHNKKSIQAVISILNPNQNPSGEIKPIKSATPLVALSHLRWNQLSVQSKAMIAQSLQATEKQKSRLSPSGRFRIHYDTTGNDTPALLNAGQTQALPNTYEAYIDSVAAVFDYCWTFQIDSLGYNPPAPHIGPSGNPEYDIYIENLGPDTFGETFWDDTTRVASLPNTAPRYWTYTIVDNDFLEFRTKGIDALRATAAHEFQHAIHLGGYGLWDVRDEFFFELSAGWMEGVNFPLVHDYFYDVADYFTGFRDANGSSLPFFDNTSYGSERGIWGQFIAKQLGRDMIRKIWEFEMKEGVMPAINDALAANGYDMNTEFSLFSYWNYFTADRADTILYYPEGKNYPRFKPTSTTTYLGTTTSLSGQAHTLSTSFYEFPLASDTLTAIVTNADIQESRQYVDTTFSLLLELGMSDQQPPGTKPVEWIESGIWSNRSNELDRTVFTSVDKNGYSQIHRRRITQSIVTLQGCPACIAGERPVKLSCARLLFYKFYVVGVFRRLFRFRDFPAEVIFLFLLQIYVPGFHRESISF